MHSRKAMAFTTSNNNKKQVIPCYYERNLFDVKS